ncbi:MAG TPA: ATP synthase F0 subunit B [Polyangiaceae bacterium]|jgi:F-type H+-transporting ATPase subunit b
MLIELCAATSSDSLSAIGSAWNGRAITIDLDKTVLVQAVLFTVLLVVLKPLLFDPMLKVFAAREERTEGTRAKARELQEHAGELLRRYEKELERVHKVAAEERERLRTETAKLEAEIVREARDVTARIVDEGRRKIESEVTAIRASLGRESERVAEQISERVLGRPVN